MSNLATVTVIPQGSKLIDTSGFDIYEKRRSYAGIPANVATIQGTGQLYIRKNFVENHMLDKLHCAMVAYDKKRNMIALRFNNNPPSKTNLKFAEDHSGNKRILIKGLLEQFKLCDQALSKQFYVDICHDHAGNVWYCVELDRPYV